MAGEPAESASKRARRAIAKVVRDAPYDGAYAPASTADLGTAVNACRRCDLWRNATQGVAGEGPANAAMMLVGEQPGDLEDQAGRPFVGPAGGLMDRALEEASVARKDCYVTNAVKHFKYELRGKRRIHAKPNTGEISACRWWLENEIRLVGPRVIVALGATAGRSVLGRTVSVMKDRGAPIVHAGLSVLVTVHPSYMLRIPDELDRRRAYALFVGDLRRARSLIA
jgi:DNA polymerase